MGLILVISFLFFQRKTAFNVNTPCSMLTIWKCLLPFAQALCIRSCHENLILTRKSHNCAGIEFIQGDSAGGSKLIEQTSHFCDYREWSIPGKGSTLEIFDGVVPPVTSKVDSVPESGDR